MKYIRRQYVVEAVKWDPNTDIDPYPDWFVEAMKRHPAETGSITVAKQVNKPSYLFVRTPSGLKRCFPGEYVVLECDDLFVYVPNEFKEKFIGLDEAAKPLNEFFRKLRFDESYHLGLGDIRLTRADQDCVIKLAFQNHNKGDTNGTKLKT